MPTVEAVTPGPAETRSGGAAHHDEAARADETTEARDAATPVAPRPTLHDLFGRSHAIARAGIQRKSGAGATGIGHEQHADQVGDFVVARKPPEHVLGRAPDSSQRGVVVQRSEARPEDTATRAALDIAPPIGGIDKTGFIDNSDGAFIRTGPREAGGTPVRAAPLPPATRVFATGRHPSAPEWLYVTAFLSQEMVRGYVQGPRVTFDLPEPLAELRQLHGGETIEGLAKEKFGHAARDGHDLRFYENVLLQVNKGRAGVSGTYQEPGALGGGANNIQLVAGHRIWLVSAEFARSLEGIVPSGSLTGGAVAKARRFAGHVEDILRSVTESRYHLSEVAGEYAQAIREHQHAILGIVGGFLMAEAASALLAATPTGVTQIIAVVIQLTLSALGAAGMVEAGAAAVQHGAAWLNTAWMASGNAEKIADASRAFIKMLVSLAMAALSYLGAKGNYGNAVKIASSMPTGGLPALAISGGGQFSEVGARSGVVLDPTIGSLGFGGNAMMQADNHGSKSEGDSVEETTGNSEKEKAPARAINESELKQAGIKFSRPQLQHAFKHASDFAVTGTVNNATLEAFKLALQKHIASQATRAIPGSYRGLQGVTHFVDPSTGLNVIRDASGEFLSGWKLSAQQLQHVLTTGKLGGG